MFIQKFGEENRYLAVKEGKTSNSGLAAWFVSNCESYSLRKDFAEKLKKYIPVDIYGSCGNFKCHGDKGDCMGMVNRTYKVGFDKNNKYQSTIIHLVVLPLTREFSLQGLRDRKVLESPPLQRDPDSAKCCKHV